MSMKWAIGFIICYAVVRVYELTKPDMTVERTGVWKFVVDCWIMTSWMIFPIIAGLIGKYFLDN